MPSLTLEQASMIVDGVLKYARENGLKPLAVAVLDARGVQKFFLAQDGTSLRRGEIALGKANGAIALGVGPRTLNKMALERPHFINGVALSVGGPVVPVPGGALIRNAAGAVIGVVGISGDTSDNDEAAALAGITAAGLIGETGE
jgi:uncharacterized protein GlcG (DUF336 family)